ncbi:MAG: hypothetical protein A2Y62_02185 [Candidatus Fischerbacteria bacterium RBG_13_37_8]|uniref:Uncharacterized protein n=1 Tax=Candidatus Fischerbacteria bacterium RBG_13_37_8 TaxID=1817863 RepID=A0A1F5VJN1_9BACT|nr:MAG: hypothetical protein A2Y62_02185 [Candidatus Fischerbacteria bacterium RBG_13_37_8]
MEPDIENCQVVGFASGVNEEEAFERLIEKNEYIIETRFNERKMPDSFFEVEHTTNFINSLLKYAELQDFNAKFYIVADKSRKFEYVSKSSQAIFKPICERIIFLDYELVSKWHSNTYEKKLCEDSIYE